MTATAVTIPLLTLKDQHAEIGAEVKAAVARVLDSGVFILGPENKAFDAEFAAAVGAKFCLGVDSGTSALELALEAAGVGPGDEVVVPTFTFIATATAVSVLGATPVFADVDPVTLTLDSASVLKKLTSRTKAIVPVHIFGQPADMDPLMDLARSRKLAVVEDCAQSHLATYKGRLAGSIGDLAAFSFYPSKNLGAAGDAGAVTTGDEKLRDAVNELRNCGRSAAAGYNHVRVGHNCRLDEIQAAVLRVKLLRLEAWTNARRKIAALYDDGLKGLPLKLPPLGSGGTKPVFHLYTVRTERRDALAAHLRAAGIGTGVYYPVSAHQQPAYAALGAKGGPLPVAEAASREALSLPMYPELPAADAARVVAAVRAFFK
ncbi:MAG: DegT/DnrJ/EryC1/StrS family aminotransferase [Elusimicrobiota bacterium]|nr:MAG: DegT/DnrJ/EryC1/StrS family aminotransferase [Elusimicrobiota bacterium]